MTFDKFLRRNQRIAEHLAQIATHRDAIGWVDSATPLDAAFRDVLAAQERLLTAAERLLESCAAGGGESAMVKPEAPAAHAGVAVALAIPPPHPLTTNGRAPAAH